MKNASKQVIGKCIATAKNFWQMPPGHACYKVKRSRQEEARDPGLL